MTALLRRHPLVCFVVLAYGFTGLVVLPLALSNHGIGPFTLPAEWEALAAFGPLLAAWMVLRAATSRSALNQWLAGFKRWRLGAAGWLWSVGTPLMIFAAALALTALAEGGLAALQWPEPSMALLRHSIDLVIVASILQSLGEEPGWRGFLLPRLRQRFGPLTATFTLYPFWLCWHLPMVLARPDFTLAQFAGFALGILAAAIWLTAIYEITRSFVAAIVWHALVNVTRGLALEVSTAAFLNYGMVVTAGALAVGVWLWRRKPSRLDRQVAPG